ncbi:hypothetical protein FSY45_19265 [Comamonas sp. Z1]|uniref:hypothetical protein n=1 Tax=Comamonas sp. Z1 TaxID=2601246 RepID=UPI0011E809D7|nr:hypothetical protein [Comamonas sp. Z1]TYK74306.1 hypothetical protein FSY45_19265 [Comamonas sp. Z1]
MNSNEFRAELVKIMPGYCWTVHRDPAWLRKAVPAPEGLSVYTATGTKSSGSNRLSTLEVTRREDNGHVTYSAKSSGYGTRSRWLHEHKDGTLARALRGLQDHYEAMASKYATHAGDLKSARIAAKAAAQSKG